MDAQQLPSDSDLSASTADNPRNRADDNFDVSPGLLAGVSQLIRFRWLLLIGSLLLGGLALPYSLSLQFDRSLERLFHQSDPRLTNYLESKEIFGAQETCVVAYSDPDLISVDGLDRLEQFSKQLADVPGVDSIMSLAGMRRPSAPLSDVSLKEVLASGAATADDLRKELIGSDLYLNRLISPDGQTTAVVVTLKLLEDTDQPRAQTIKRLREIADQYPGEALVAGGPVLVDDVFSHLENDGQKLGIYSTLVMTLVIAIMFRNLRWMFMPLIVVHLALIWTKASMVIAGMKLSMVSSPLVALVTVIGVGTVVHFAIRYREYRSWLDPQAAMRGTLAHVGPATAWTILTTMGGFFSLMVSRIVPVQSFGLMMGIGTLFVLVAILGVISGAVLIGGGSSDPQRAPGEKKAAVLLQWLNRAVERYPWLFATVGLVMLGFLTIGTTRLESATDFTDNFHEDSPIVQSYKFISERLGATGGFDLIIDGPSASDPKFDDFIEQVRQIQRELLQVEGVLGSMSLTDLFAFMQNKNGPQPTNLSERFAQAAIANLAPRYLLGQIDKREPGLVSGFWNKDRNVLRISVLTGDLEGNQAKIDRLNAVEAIGLKYFPGARSAGSEILIMFLVSSMLSDQWITFGVAVLLIFVMLSLSFRSPVLGVLALIPNASPILIVIGSMGWLGLKMNMATAMLASVSMGLAVDFSIHYLYRFRHELKSGADFNTAIGQAHGSVGLAIMLANLALIAGFMVLTLSNFVPTVQFGYLVTIVMLGGLAANLVVLPILLRALYRIWPSAVGP
ncbi:MAG: MMPL family transporter [Pirellulaceae bacterium]|nr:MMPL family transporter [Pirellulaceae bacterium]